MNFDEWVENKQLFFDVDRLGSFDRKVLIICLFGGKCSEFDYLRCLLTAAHLNRIFEHRKCSTFVYASKPPLIERICHLLHLNFIFDKKNADFFDEQLTSSDETTTELSRICWICQRHSFEIVYVVHSSRFQQNLIETLNQYSLPDTKFVDIPIAAIQCKGLSSSISKVDEYMTCRRHQAVQLYTRKYPSSMIDDQIVDKMFRCIVSFELLTKNFDKVLTLLPFDNPNEELPSLCISGVKVLYNYARICSVYKKFDEEVAVGRYPTLVPVQELKSNEKAKVFDQMKEFLDIFRYHFEEEQRWTSSCSKLIEFATKFSKYYRKNQILVEPNPNVITIVHAKVHLLLWLKRSLAYELSIVNVQPLEEM